MKRNLIKTIQRMMRASMEEKMMLLRTKIFQMMTMRMSLIKAKVQMLKILKRSQISRRVQRATSIVTIWTLDSMNHQKRDLMTCQKVACPMETYPISSWKNNGKLDPTTENSTPLLF